MRIYKNRQRKNSRVRRQVPATSYVDYEVEGRTRAKSRSRLGRLIAHHGWVAKTSLQQMLQTPLSTALTAAVIAIALSLPSGLFLLLNDLQNIVVGWQGTAQISVFLKKSVPGAQAKSVSLVLRGWDEIAEVRYVSAEQALEEFQQHSGFGDALSILNENPLPAVLVITPRREYLSAGKLQPLANKLRQLPEVDLVQLDHQWIERLNTLIDLGKRGALILSATLALAVLIVIGNTIRLTIYNRRQEILVTKLIGATNSFIRRPFLYTGLWYGIGGAVLSITLISLLFWLISGPVRSLAGLYNSPFHLTGLTVTGAALVFTTAVALGLLGSWIAVTRHIQLIEPK
ncbi:MAG: permease-like cell division protein FtsX [Gammaproteobacteria bacterium]|nr:permease-like cell division protein FtsX [Gammaproteobacteria bacterium]